jgi:hypothetical protein
MLDSNQAEELDENSFLRIEGYLTNEVCQELYDWMDDSQKYYTQDNLRDKIAYPSDSSSTRVSNAYMVSGGFSPLPHIALEKDAMGSLLDDFQAILAQMDELMYGLDTFLEVHATRCMLNMQKYFAGSKEVPWHFDGEYLKSKGNTTRIEEGLVPRYIAVYTLSNQNTHGTKVRCLQTGNEFQAESKAGDMIIIDNLRYLHSVPILEKPRLMIGFRNFDYRPHYFNQNGEGKEVSNACFDGHQERISTEASESIQHARLVQHRETFDMSTLEAKF